MPASGIPPIVIEILGDANGFNAAVAAAMEGVENLTADIIASQTAPIPSIEALIAALDQESAAYLQTAMASQAGRLLILNDAELITVAEEDLAGLQEKLAADVAIAKINSAVKSFNATQAALAKEAAAHEAAFDRAIAMNERFDVSTEATLAKEAAAYDRMWAQAAAANERFDAAFQAALTREAEALFAATTKMQADWEAFEAKRLATQVATGEAIIADMEAEAAASAAARAEMITGVGGAVGRMGSSIAGFGQTLMFDVALPMLTIGGIATGMAIHFEDSMKKVSSLTNASVDDIKVWRADLMKLSDQYGVSATEAADALYLIASNNVKGKEATDALAASMEAASTGLGKVGDIARLTSSALNAYAGQGIKSKDVTDVLTAAAREGHMTTETLANAFSRVLPVASAMHVRLGDVGAAFAVISREGMNANEAATAIRAMFSQLEKNSSQTANGLKAVGLSAEGLRKQIRDEGLLSALETLRDKTHLNDAALAKIFGNVRGLTGVLNILTQDSKDVHDAFDKVTNSVGSTDRAAAAASETLGFKFNQAINEVKNALIRMGDIFAPIITKIVAFVGQLLNKFNDLSPAMKQIIVIGGLIVAAMGPVLMIFGAIVGAVGAAIAGIAAFTPEIAAVAAGVVAAVAIIVAAIAAWVAIITQIWQSSQAFRDGVMQIWATIREGIANAIKILQDKLKEHEEDILKLRAIFKMLGDFLASSIVPMIQTTLVIAFKVLGKAIGDTIDIMSGAIAGFMSFYNEHIPLFTEAIYELVNPINQLILAWNTLDKTFDGGRNQITPIIVHLGAVSVGALKAADAQDALTQSTLNLHNARNQLARDSAEASDTYAAQQDAARKAADDLKAFMDALNATGGSGAGSAKAKATISDKIKQAFSDIEKNVKQYASDFQSSMKSIADVQADTVEQFTALSASGVKVDIPSAIQKAFGSGSSVDSAIAEFNKLATGLKGISSSQKSTLASLTQTSINFLSQNDAINKSISEAKTKLSAQIVEINSKYDSLDKTAAADVARIKADYDALSPALNSALQSATEAFTKQNTILDGLISARQQAMDSIKSGFTSFADSLQLDPRARTFTRSLELRLQEVKNFNANIKALLAAGLDASLVQQFVQQGPEAAGATVKQLAGASAATIAHLNDMQAQLNAEVTDFQDVVSKQWHDAAIAQQQAIVSPLKTAVEVAQAAVDSAKAAYDRDLANAEAHAAALKVERQKEIDDATAQFDAFQKDQQKRIDANNAALQANAELINKTVTDLAAALPQQLFDAGVASINGLTNGLKDSKALHDLVASARAAAAAAIAAMKHELGIASPSKVTMELGGHVAAGLALGIRGGSGAVGTAAAGLARSAVPSIPYVQSSAGGQVMYAQPVSSSNTSNVTVNAMTNADAHVIAREVAWAIKVGV